MGINDKKSRGSDIVRDPKQVQREQQPDFSVHRAQIAAKLEGEAQAITEELVKAATHNQTVNDNNEFQARVDLRRFESRALPLYERVKVLVTEALGDAVDVTIMLFDMSSPYGGREEARDITIWATPRRN